MYNGEFSPTETSIINCLGLFRYAYGSQLQRLFFRHGSSLAMTRARNRTLRKLVDLKVLYRYPRARLPGKQHGSTEHVYTLAAAGQRLHAKTQNHPYSFRSLDRTTTHIAHTLAITELHVQLSELATQNTLQLISSLPEPYSYRQYGIGKVIKPDYATVYRVRHNGRLFEHAWVIEVERTRQREAATIAKLRAYEDYFEQLASDSLMPRVLFLCFTQSHTAHLQRLLQRNAAGSQDLFLVASNDSFMDVMLPAPN